MSLSRSLWLCIALFCLTFGCGEGTLESTNPATSHSSLAFRVTGAEGKGASLRVAVTGPDGATADYGVSLDERQEGTLDLPPADYQVVAVAEREGAPTGVARTSVSLSAGQTSTVDVLCGEPTGATEATPEALAPIQPRNGQKPNIVLIVLDDLDYTDVGIYGKSYPAYGPVRTKTSRIDQLASQGVRFTQFYSSAAKCSPTRSAILTSQPPAYFGWRDVVGVYTRTDGTTGPARRTLPWRNLSVAQYLKNQGYATGLIGKWHVGDSRPSGLPQAMGFDESIRWDPNLIDNDTGDGFYWGYRLTTTIGATPSQTSFAPRLGQPGADDNYLNKRLTDEAIAFVTRHRSQPFFLDLSHICPHLPLHVPARFNNAGFGYDLSTDVGKSSAMVSDVDREVGRLVDAIDQLGLGSNTLILVISDNGGTPQGRWYPAADRTGIRQGKSHVYEGGVRVPFVARWSGTITPNTINYSLVSTLDLLPTFLDVASAAIPRDIGGRSLYDNLVSGVRNNTQNLFWLAPRFPDYATAQLRQATYPDFDQFSVRSWKYKLVRSKFGNALELYDLTTGTQGEFTDIAAQNPEIVADYFSRYKSWHRTVGVVPYLTTVQNSVFQVRFDPRLDSVDADGTVSVTAQASTMQQNGVIAAREGAWELRWVNGKVELRLFDDRPGVPQAQRMVVLSSHPLNTNQPHTITFTLYGQWQDNLIPSLYVDKVLESQIMPDQYPPGQGLHALTSNNSPLYVGSLSDGSQAFQGTVKIEQINTLALPVDEQ